MMSQNVWSTTSSCTRAVDPPARRGEPTSPSSSSAVLARLPRTGAHDARPALLRERASAWVLARPVASDFGLQTSGREPEAWSPEPDQKSNCALNLTYRAGRI